MLKTLKRLGKKRKKSCIRRSKRKESPAQVSQLQISKWQLKKKKKSQTKIKASNRTSAKFFAETAQKKSLCKHVFKISKAKKLAAILAIFSWQLLAWKSCNKSYAFDTWFNSKKIAKRGFGLDQFRKWDQRYLSYLCSKARPYHKNN